MTRNVADRKCDASVGRREGVVPIAPDARLALGRTVRVTEVDAIVRGQVRRQHRVLERGGNAMFAFVEPGVVDGQRRAACELLGDLERNLRTARRRVNGDQMKRALGLAPRDERHDQRRPQPGGIVDGTVLGIGHVLVNGAPDRLRIERVAARLPQHLRRAQSPIVHRDDALPHEGFESLVELRVAVANRFDDQLVVV